MKFCICMMDCIIQNVSPSERRTPSRDRGRRNHRGRRSQTKMATSTSQKERPAERTSASGLFGEHPRRLWEDLPSVSTETKIFPFSNRMQKADFGCKIKEKMVVMWKVTRIFAVGRAKNALRSAIATGQTAEPEAEGLHAPRQFITDKTLFGIWNSRTRPPESSEDFR